MLDEATTARSFPARSNTTTSRRRQPKVLRLARGNSHQHGQCGMELSELLPNFAGIVDDEITLIRSMQTGVNNHGQSIYALQQRAHHRRTPDARLVAHLRPRHGIAGAARLLVALTDPRGLPVLGVEQFTNGWLPSLYQGTAHPPQ